MASFFKLRQNFKNIDLKESESSPPSGQTELRKKHSHRCHTCHEAHWCYKSTCTQPQKVQCNGCKNGTRSTFQPLRPLRKESFEIFPKIMALNSKLDTIKNLTENNNYIPVCIKTNLDIISEQLEIIERELKMDLGLTEIKESCVSTKVVGILSEAIEKDLNSVDYVLNDGTGVALNKDSIKAVCWIHDSLNEDCQEKLRILLSESGESFRMGLEFCLTQYQDEISNND